MAKNDKSNGNLQTNNISQDEIAKRAYEIYERNGCQPGRDVENWLAAEAELSAAQKQQSAQQKQESTKRPRSTPPMNQPPQIPQRQMTPLAARSS